MLSGFVTRVDQGATATIKDMAEENSRSFKDLVRVSQENCRTKQTADAIPLLQDTSRCFLIAAGHRQMLFLIAAGHRQMLFLIAAGHKMMLFLIVAEHRSMLFLIAAGHRSMLFLIAAGHR